MPTLSNLRQELKSKANPKRAKLSSRYFKTGKGEYGEGDVFLGLSSVIMRPIAKKYKDLKLGEIQKLLKSKIHEERQTALLILVEQFQGAILEHSTMTRHSAKFQGTMLKHSVVLKHNTQASNKIFKFYLKNTKYINNWDLIDLSAPKIVGEYFLHDASINGSTRILYKLAKSKNLWQRRIAIIATFAFIKNNQFSETLKIAEMLLNDKHDLIHKANGWMLREVGKQSPATLEKFLEKNASKMPRVMLRYAIERLPEKKRKEYLGG